MEKNASAFDLENTTKFFPINEKSSQFPKNDRKLLQLAVVSSFQNMELLCIFLSGPKKNTKSFFQKMEKKNQKKTSAADCPY